MLRCASQEEKLVLRHIMGMLVFSELMVGLAKCLMGL